LQLAQAARPVQGPYQATEGEPDRSPRYREILARWASAMSCGRRCGSVP
jgi:hypothetical protein